MNGDTTFRTKCLVHFLALFLGAVGFSMACVGGTDGEWLTLCFMCINIALFFLMCAQAARNLEWPRTAAEWPNKYVYVELMICTLAGRTLL